MRLKSIKNILINFVLVSVLGFAAVWLGLYFADKYIGGSNIVVSPTKTPSAIPTISMTAKLSPTPSPSLYEKIQEAKKILKSSVVLKYETKNGNLVRKQIALAILNRDSGKIFEKRMWVKEDDIKNYMDTNAIVLTPDSVDNLTVIVKQWNSFNSYYEINGAGIKPGSLIVVANKYLLLSSNLNNLPERSSKKYTDIIYVPYSTALDESDIISAGKQYIGDIVERGFADLNKKNIESLSNPGNLATAVVDKKFVKNILLIEHIDPDLFSVSTDGGRELAERMLAIIGSNRENSYRYTGSPAGANGLAQFIKPTYDIIVSNYPAAELIKDYYLGMADHTNAVKAMILFFDYYKADIVKKITQPIQITDNMLVAAYNGGTTPVIQSINKYGVNWFQTQLNLPENKQTIHPETMVYLQKFASIEKLFFW